MRTFNRLIWGATIAVIVITFATPSDLRATSERWQPDPDHTAWVYYQIGLYQQSLGNHGNAVISFSRALQLQPSAEVYEARGDSYVDLERYELAIADYTSALGLGANGDRLYAKRAYAYAACDDFEHGRQDFEQIISGALLF